MPPAWTRPRPLPEAEPVAWRQRFTKMGRTGRLGLASVAAAGGAIAVALLMGPDTRLDWAITIRRLALAVWAFGALMLVLQASSAFSAERSQDTLNILLTTPLGGRELIRQKMVLMRRWAVALCSVLFLLAGLYFATMLATASDKAFAFRTAMLHVACIALGGVIYLPLLTWVGMLIGLCITSHERAASTAITVVAAWLVAGMVMPTLALELIGAGSGSWLRNATLVSPATILVESAFNTIEDHLRGPPGLVVAVNFAAYGWLLHRIRRHVLGHADEYLGRAAEKNRQHPTLNIQRPTSNGTEAQSST